MTTRYFHTLILGVEVHGGCQVFLHNIVRCRNAHRPVVKHFYVIMLAYNGWVAKKMLWPEF
jgi:hypothetical protein